jgi:hypothetical protein
MHFHLPKPLHGWRALLGEVGIIVVGVLIALGAEQVVDDWQWQKKVGVVRRSLMGELANDRARWEVDVATARCASEDIDRADRWVQGAGPAASMPTIRVIRTQNWFWMHWANWNLATGSQTLDHFAINDQLAFAALYDGIAHRQVDIEKASDLIGRVKTLIPLADDAQGRRELRSAMGNLQWELEAVIGNAEYMKRHFDAVGVKPDRTDFAPDFKGQGCTY